ncbi:MULTISPECIES: hypothetical protein [Xenorhabdus]|uniref:hypothetical protein n=1 Tax=Xenorhabdus TaxID=626 RepID=UPI00064AA068|nr:MULTISPECIES: hypothetical protein [Xenorhabdus]KLU17163.1 hypothetical protein AAY47_01740 [Xenorhabdus griffiniae]KOP32762.1 hypothetical protein AFK69_13720 [Xenorhabdus sp. GDc328]
MISKIKSALYTGLSVIAVLFAAYLIGGRAAKKSVEIKRRQEENQRLQTTLDVKKEVEHEVQQKEIGAAVTELRNDWMRK